MQTTHDREQHKCHFGLVKGEVVQQLLSHSWLSFLTRSRVGGAAPAPELGQTPKWEPGSGTRPLSSQPAGPALIPTQMLPRRTGCRERRVLWRTLWPSPLALGTSVTYPVTLLLKRAEHQVSQREERSAPQNPPVSGNHGVFSSQILECGWESRPGRSIIRISSPPPSILTG